MKPCLVPVSAASALAWCRGDLHDRDLLLQAPLTPEAIFGVNLPPHTLRAAVRRLYELRQAGCVCFIGRTYNWPWLANLTRRGAVVTFQEHYAPMKDVRYIIPPAALDAWLAPLKRWL